MKACVDWVLARRYRLIVLAMALAPVVPMVTAALMTVETVRRGAAQGLVSALIGIGGMVVLALVTGAGIGVGLPGFLTGIAIGALLRWAGTMTLAFQGTLLGASLLVGVATLVGPGPHALLAPLVDELVEVLRAGGASEQRLDLLQGQAGTALLLAVMFLQLVAALLLAQWWLGIAHRDRRFGAEFRRLKLGRVLGIPATVLVGLGLVFDAPLVQNLAPLGLCGFLLEGLAVMHAWAHARKWHPAMIVPVYVLLVNPLTALVVVFALSAAGLVDNWLDLRAPLSPQA